MRLGETTLIKSRNSVFIKPLALFATQNGELFEEIITFGDAGRLLVNILIHVFPLGHHIAKKNRTCIAKEVSRDEGGCVLTCASE